MKSFLPSPAVPSPDPLSLPLNTPESIGARSWLRFPWDVTAMAIGLLYWGIFGTLLTLIGGPLHVLLPKRQGECLGRLFLHHLFRWFVKLLRLMDLVRADLSDLDRLAKIDTPFIVAPNHTSLWDAVFLIARLPRTVCVMKKSIVHNPVLGGGARLAGYIANDGMTRLIRSAVDALHHGGQLLLFPEGTRTKADARWINPLKGGCAIIAERAQVPVYPVFIRSNSRFLQKGWPLWKRPVFPIDLRIEVGEAMRPQTGESAQAFTQRLEEQFERELAKPHPLRRQIDANAQQPAS